MADGGLRRTTHHSAPVAALMTRGSELVPDLSPTAEGRWPRPPKYCCPAHGKWALRSGARARACRYCSGVDTKLSRGPASSPRWPSPVRHPAARAQARDVLVADFAGGSAGGDHAGRGAEADEHWSGTARPIAILPAVRPRGRACDALAKPASSPGAAPPLPAPAATARWGPRTVVPRARMCAADHSTPINRSPKWSPCRVLNLPSSRR
jgi:hypothetical protein